MNIITAAILCGGLGTRLRPVVGKELPKCLAPIKDKPFLFYVLDRLFEQGVRRIVFCLGHGSKKVIKSLSGYTSC